MTIYGINCCEENEDEYMTVNNKTVLISGYANEKANEKSSFLIEDFDSETRLAKVTDVTDFFSAISKIVEVPIGTVTEVISKLLNNF